MITTVTLNPCFDKTLFLSSFSLSSMNRVNSYRLDPSGKAINVSLALEEMGYKTNALGFLYTKGKEDFLSLLREKNLDYRFIEAQGRIRENIKIWDDESKRTIEVNQSGEVVPPEKWQDFKELFSSFLPFSTLVILSGSVPKGIGEDAYKEMVELANKYNKPVFVDAEGPLLLKALEASPTLIKPNLYELKKTFGLESENIVDIVKLGHDIIREYKVKYVVVSLSEDGALLIEENHQYFAPALSVNVKSTQGAGDCMVAGCAVSYLEKKDAKEMLKYAISAASSKIEKEGTDISGLSLFKKYIPQVTVSEVYYE